MIKFIALLKRRDGLGHEQFVDYWLNKHAPIAKNMPGLRRYVINVPRISPSREPEFDGVAELWFDDMDSARKAWASEAGQATMKDTSEFSAKTISLYAEEKVML